MTALAKYLRSARNDRVYDSEELSRLQAVFDQACAELHLDPHSSRAESLAALLFQAEATCAPSDLLGVLVRAFR